MPEPGPMGPLLDRARWAFARSGWAPVLAVAAVVGAVAAAAALVALPGARQVAGGGDPVAALPRAVRVTTTQPPPPPLVIDVAGAVLHPGLVQLAEGARVADALAAAGGLRPDADASRLNLAEKLRDGARLYVLAVGEVAPPAVSAAGGGSSGGGGTGGAGGAGEPIDLNRASAEELDALPGVGPATAAAIVAHRQANGPFSSVDQLGDVRGIGPAKLEALRPLVRV